MWHDSLITKLDAQPICGYQAHDSGAAEPTALATWALAVAGRPGAIRGAEWLVELQAGDGSVSVRAGADGPRWPTSLAVLAWLAMDRVAFADPIDRAIGWMLAARGTTQPRSDFISHDSTLAAWPWVAGTHSWVEPTALHILALKAAGYGKHPRTREAVRMLVDRQIPGGGCNYGNSGVLGQWLRPHVQPTGLALWALGGESLAPGRVKSSITWLRQALSPRTTSISLAWGLLGLAAHTTVDPDTLPSQAGDWLARAATQPGPTGHSQHKAALLLLADRAVTRARGLTGPQSSPPHAPRQSGPGA